MRNNRVRLIATLVLVGVCGCTITQTARPVTLQPNESKEMCVVWDPSVDETFLPAYQAALQRKGFTIKMIAPGSPPNSCPLTSTYYARWSWDFVTYMSIAKIVVYRNGTQVGDAVYDAPKAGWSLTTRIYESTESKIDTMVAQLFPHATAPQ